MTMSLAELFLDPELDIIIRRMSNHEYDLAKSELFLILCEKRKVEFIPTHQQQLAYCADIVRKQIQSNTSPFHKTWRNHGQTLKFKTIEFDKQDVIQEDYQEPTYYKILDRINLILNKDIPWYDASLFRLYYLPYDDPSCDQKVYSLRTLEKMHTSGNYRIDHMSIYNKVKNTFILILTKLKEEGMLTDNDIKNMKTKKIFKKIC